MFRKLNPNLMVKDVKKTVEFYKEYLGFELVMAVPETQDKVLTDISETQNVVYAQVKNGSVEIMFQLDESLKEDVPVFANMQIGASVALYMEIENIEELYNSIKAKVDVVKKLAATWYGMNEFYIRDNNGYILGFSEEKK